MEEIEFEKCMWQRTRSNSRIQSLCLTKTSKISFRLFNLLSRAEYLPIVCRRLLSGRKLVKYTYGYLTNFETRFARKRSLQRDISILGSLLVSSHGIFLAVLASRIKVTIQ